MLDDRELEDLETLIKRLGFVEIRPEGLDWVELGDLGQTPLPVNADGARGQVDQMTGRSAASRPGAGVEDRKSVDGGRSPSTPYPIGDLDDGNETTPGRH